MPENDCYCQVSISTYKHRRSINHIHCMVGTCRNLWESSLKSFDKWVQFLLIINYLILQLSQSCPIGTSSFYPSLFEHFLVSDKKHTRAHTHTHTDTTTCLFFPCFMHWNQTSPLHKNPNFFCWRMFFRRYKWMLCVRVQSLQSCLTLDDPMDYGLAGSSAHGILQARILGWVVMPAFRGSWWPKDRTSCSCIAGRFFTLSHRGNQKVDAIQAHYYWCVYVTRTSLQTELQNADIHTGYIHIHICIYVCVCLYVYMQST